MLQKVGYDAGDQFSFHWWDHVFNKAAKSIVVQESDVRTLEITIITTFRLMSACHIRIKNAAIRVVYMA